MALCLCTVTASSYTSGCSGIFYLSILVTSFEGSFCTGAELCDQDDLCIIPTDRSRAVKLGRVSHSVPSHLHCLCLFSPRLRGYQVLSACSGFVQSKLPRKKQCFFFELLLKCFRSDFYHYRVLQLPRLTRCTLTFPKPAFFSNLYEQERRVSVRKCQQRH